MAQPKPVPPDSPVELGDVIAGKYRVREVIAVGGMGIVLGAEHQQLGQEVAIKVLLPTELAQEPHAAMRFLREARAAAQLRSDHVVRIYDVDTLPDGLPYMVMERLHGQDLRALVRERGPLPIEDVVDYVIHACDAVGEAHRAGIVHRDLKPANLFLISRTDGSSLVKVLDFGISKASAQAALEGTLTTSRTLIGSPLYMSPEQIRDPKSVDARSDIWSFGVILHQLLTGKQAFTADSLPGVCAAIAADPPQSTRELRPEVPAELEAVIRKCLEKRPDDRYQNVEELCAALAPFGRLGSASLAPTVPVSSLRWIPPSGTFHERPAPPPPPPPPPAPPARSEMALASSQTLVSSGFTRPRVLVPVALVLVAALAVASFFVVRPGSESSSAAGSAASAPAPADPSANLHADRATLPAVSAPAASASAAPTATARPRAPERPRSTGAAAKPTAPKPAPETDIRLER